MKETERTCMTFAETGAPKLEMRIQRVANKQECGGAGDGAVSLPWPRGLISFIAGASISLIRASSAIDRHLSLVKQKSSNRKRNVKGEHTKDALFCCCEN